MRFIVKPIVEIKNGRPNITQCALCSENPAFCSYS
jgi:hypothetical protein